MMESRQERRLRVLSGIMEAVQADTREAKLLLGVQGPFSDWRRTSPQLESR
jgi:hypothetical protein